MVSFIISTYEYNHVQQQYDNAIKLAEANAAVQKKIKDDVAANQSEGFNFYSAYNEQYLKMKNIVRSFDFKKINSWSNQVMDTQQYGEPFLRFTLTAIITVGAILKLSYQTYGMAGLPIYLIKGTKSLEAESDEISGTIQSVREQLRQIQEKYHRNQKTHITAKDKLELKKLRKDEKILS